MAKAENTNGPPKSESRLVPSVEQVEEKESVIHKVEVSFTNESKPFVNPNDVDFLIEYSKDFKGKKIVPEGLTIVSKETAELFEARGMGIQVK